MSHLSSIEVGISTRPGRVAKASTGPIPQPFAISNTKKCIKALLMKFSGLFIRLLKKNKPRLNKLLVFPQLR